MVNKKWIFAFVLIALLIYSPCYAQEWSKTYGGSNQDSDCSIIRTLDGGYIVAGRTYSFGVGSADFWILKLSSSGTVEWEKTYGGSGQDWASSIKQTPDGGYIVAGTTDSFGSVWQDIWVLRLNSSGAIIWQNIYDLGVSEIAPDIQLTSDGGYIVAGYSAADAGISDIWVLKLNPDGHPNGDGSIAWQKTYGGDNWDTASSIQETYNQSGEPDGYIVAGRTDSFGAGKDDVWILKLNLDGTLAWDKTYGGSEGDWAFSIRQTFNQSGDPDGYIVAGETHSFGLNSFDAWILKLHNDGSVAWQKTYGGNNKNDGAESIEQTSDGGYIFAGNTRSFGAGEWDLWVLKLYANGNIEWQKTYGGAFWETHPTILQTSAGGYAMSGFTKTYGVGPIEPWGSRGDIWVLKLNGNGNIPNCSLVGTSNAQVIDTNATGLDTTAVVFDTYASPQTITASVSNANEAVKEQCLYGCILVPDDIFIPQGGTLGFQGTVMNNTGQTGSVFFATKVTLPNGNRYPFSGYLISPLEVYLNPYQSKSGHRSHDIPLGAQLGTYTYHGYVGNYGAGLYDECQFKFTVTPQ